MVAKAQSESARRRRRRRDSQGGGCPAARSSAGLKPHQLQFDHGKPRRPTALGEPQLDMRLSQRVGQVVDLAAQPSLFASRPAAFLRGGQPNPLALKELVLPLADRRLRNAMRGGPPLRRSARYASHRARSAASSARSCAQASERRFLADASTGTRPRTRCRPPPRVVNRTGEAHRLGNRAPAGGAVRRLSSACDVSLVRALLRHAARKEGAVLRCGRRGARGRRPGSRRGHFERYARLQPRRRPRRPPSSMRGTMRRC